jgi:hypothetical protein
VKLFRLSAAALLVLTAISTPTHSLSATRVDARNPLRVVLQGGPGGPICDPLVQVCPKNN